MSELMDSTITEGRKILRQLYFDRKLDLHQYFILNNVVQIAEMQKKDVVYLCKYHNDAEPDCHHTHNIDDAKNFVKVDEDRYMEVMPDGERKT